MENRILIKEDRELLKKICRDIPEYVPLLNKVKECYEKLEMGDFSQEIYEEIINLGENKVLKKFHSFMIDQFDKANITSTIIRASMMSDTLNVRESFKNSVQELKSFKPLNIKRLIGERYDYLKPNQITYENGRFFISDENEEAILEQSCRTYIVTEKEKELLEKLQSFADSYKEIKTFLLENKLVNGLTIHGMDNYISEGTGSGFYTSTKIEVNINSFIHLLRIPEILSRMK